jgi:hypothetical protein
MVNSKLMILAVLITALTALGTEVGNAAASSPLPNDMSIFGQDVIAMYIFRSPYVTTTGTPPVVTSVANANDPGTHDVTFINPLNRPLWIANCGQDALGQTYGCARFDGIDDYGEADGFSMVTGDRPSLIAVMKMNDVSNVTAIPFQLTNEAGSQFMNLPEVRTQGENLWRYNGTFTNAPHNIDFGTPDLDLHLHEQHLASPATLAIFDGVTQPDTGGDSAINGPITIVSLGRRAPFEYAAVDIFEAIVVDQPTLAEAESYRSLRVQQEYPTIPLAPAPPVPAVQPRWLWYGLPILLALAALWVQRRGYPATSGW